MRFRPEQHVRRQRDFRSLRENGRRFDCGGFTFWYYRRPSEQEVLLRSDAPTSQNGGEAAQHNSSAQSVRPAPPESALSVTPLPAASSADVKLFGLGASSVNLMLPRVGVVASYSAVGKAVFRARAKRRLREIFRRHQQLVPMGYDVLLVARHTINKLEFSVLEQKFVEACNRVFAKSGDKK